MPMPFGLCGRTIPRFLILAPLAFNQAEDSNSSAR
jgi:hypothetical protein